MGTDRPVHRLSVIGGTPWTTTRWQGSIDFANGSAFGWRANSAGLSRGIGYASGGLYFFRTSSSPGTTASDPIYDLTINDSGRVGIGTTAPAHQLSIAGGPAWTWDQFKGVVALSNGSAIGWSNEGGAYTFGMGHTYNGFYLFRTFSALGTTTYAPIYDLAIDVNGFVGIGTATPFAKLHVEGSTYVNGTVYVDSYQTNSSAQLQVPDYVFEPEYSLMSLDELRAYIAEEKHLPNVPSEEEVRAGGLNVIDFQMRLLEKVEELTLYTLTQDEQITSLQQENQYQEQQLETLQQTTEAQDEQIQSLQQTIADLVTRLAALETQE